MNKKLLRNYNIKIQSLSNNEHSFMFEFSQDLFEFFSNENEIQNTKGSCKVVIVKSDIMLNTIFLIDGETQLICDRTLEKYIHKINFQKKILFKFGDIEEELSDEILIIDRNKPIINIAKYIYEFFILELPVKRLHPSLKNEDNIDTFVFSTKKNNEIDPRLDPLNKLK